MIRASHRLRQRRGAARLIAAEIEHVLESLRKDTMPRDDIGIEDPLDKATKSALLREGKRFAALDDLGKSIAAYRQTKEPAAVKQVK